MIEIRRLAASCVASVDRRPAAESGVDTLLVVIEGEAIQLAMKVETIPEKGLVEIFAPKSPDEALYERVRARREGNGFKFLDVEHSQIRAPAMKSEERVMIGAEALGQWLAAPNLVEHATDTDSVNVRLWSAKTQSGLGRWPASVAMA